MRGQLSCGLLIAAALAGAGCSQEEDINVRSPVTSHLGAPLFFASQGFDTVEILSNLSPVPGRVASYPGFGRVAADDFDGDGIDEVVLAYPSGGGVGAVQVLAQNGARVTRPGVPLLPGYPPNGALAVGDLDADGIPEIVVGWPDSSGGFIQISPDIPGFTAGRRFDLGDDLAVCDLNNDGFAEIVDGAGQVQIISNPAVPFPPDSEYFPSGKPGFNRSYDRITCADVNGDGFNDIVIIHGAPPGSFPSIAVHTHPSRPPITDFNNAPLNTFLGRDDAVAAGDIDGDGSAEIIIGSHPLNVLILSAAGKTPPRVPIGAFVRGDALGINNHFHPSDACDPPIPCNAPVPGVPQCPQPGHLACNNGVYGECVADVVPVDGGPQPATCPWDLLPNFFNPGQLLTRDRNGFLLNPRWGWQADSLAPPSPPVEGMSTQPRTHQSEFLCEVAGHDAPGHTNWMDATYVGPIHWDSHSPWYKDGDYNMSIRTLTVTGTPYPAGIMAGNSTWLQPSGDKPLVIQVEFSSSETIDHFDGIPWWAQLHRAVDDGGNPAACALITGHQAVATGRMGWDTGHAGTLHAKSELHPAHILAIRESLTVNPNDDRWAIFVRNWGDEGFCGEDQETINSFSLSVELPRPTPAQGVPATANGTWTAAGFNTFGVAAPSVSLSRIDRDHPNPVVTVRLAAPSARPMYVGEVSIAWSPTIPATEVPPVFDCGTTAHLDAAEELLAQADPDDDPEVVWGQAFESLTPEQQQFAFALFKGMVPPENRAMTDAQVVQGAVPPDPPSSPPTEGQEPATARRVLIDRAKVIATCAAAHGNVPGWAGVCQQTSATTLGGCVRASESIRIDNGATVMNPDGTFGALANSGRGFTQIERGAKVGAITSVGPVLVEPGATVSGSITSGSRVVVLRGATVAGTVQQNQTLQVPGVGLDVLFPTPPSRRDIHVDRRHPRSIEAGAYDDVFVESGAVLTLASGTYYFDHVTIDHFGKIAIDTRGGAVVIYVRKDLKAFGPIVDNAGGPPNLLIGVLGKSGAFLGAPFSGTIVAPSGTIFLQDGPKSAGSYTGSFMGKSVVLGHGTSVTCAL